MVSGWQAEQKTQITTVHKTLTLTSQKYGMTTSFEDVNKTRKELNLANAKEVQEVFTIQFGSYKSSLLTLQRPSKALTLCYFADVIIDVFGQVPSARTRVRTLYGMSLS